jgi:hypothetical protein
LNIAVFTLTRDRFSYTRKCFDRMREMDDCDWDHFVWDNGSQSEDDVMREYLLGLKGSGRIHGLHLHPHNVGILPAAIATVNHILEYHKKYDVIIKIDNDCWFDTNDPISTCAEVVSAEFNHNGNLFLVSPEVHGLKAGVRRTGKLSMVGGEHPFRQIYIGGIFHCAPREVFSRFIPELKKKNAPLVRGWDNAINGWMEEHGNGYGYLLEHRVDHLNTTVGQEEELPDYFARQKREWDTPCDMNEDLKF